MSTGVATEKIFFSVQWRLHIEKGMTLEVASEPTINRESLGNDQGEFK